MFSCTATSIASKQESCSFPGKITKSNRSHLGGGEFKFFIPLYRSHKRKPEYRPSLIAANSSLERCKINKSTS